MLVVGPIQDALFGLVAIANTLIGIVQEVRAKQSLDRLALVGRPRVDVVRDGREQEIEPDAVVVDDLVRLASGAQIVVDGEVVEAEAFEVDESLLTGESDAVDQAAGRRGAVGQLRRGRAGHDAGDRRSAPTPTPPRWPSRPARSRWSTRRSAPTSTGSCATSRGR